MTRLTFDFFTPFTTNKKHVFPPVRAFKLSENRVVVKRRRWLTGDREGRGAGFLEASKGAKRREEIRGESRGWAGRRERRMGGEEEAEMSGLMSGLGLPLGQGQRLGPRPRPRLGREVTV